MAKVSSIDALKGLSAMSVVALHTLYTNDLTIYRQIGAPFHIWISVTMFMIIAGYNGALSAQGAGGGALFDLPLLSKRMSRLLGPFTVIFLLEVLMNRLYQQSFWKLALLYLQGGLGPGSYFIPVMLQHVIIFPFLYRAGKLSPRGLIIGAIAFNVFLDFFLYNYIGLSMQVYRLLYLRYSLAVCLGIWVVTSKSLEYGWVLLGAIVGASYMTAVIYFGVSLPYKYNGWTTHDFISSGYVFLLFLLGLKYLDKLPDNWLARTLYGFGRASYHIFLFQMVYFSSKYAIFNRTGFRLLENGNYPLALVVDLTVCLTGGMIFYSMHQGTSSMVSKLRA